MSLAKPFHRNFRPGSDPREYIRHPKYAKDAEHYVRALLLLQSDLRGIFEYVEPGEKTRLAYSYRIHALLMRTCIEVEANFKAILGENICKSRGRDFSMIDYRKVDVTHHLSSYAIYLPIWNDGNGIFKPFEKWLPLRGLPSQSNGRTVKVGLPWYDAYNASKHNRHEGFKEANLGMLVEAIGGLLVLVAAQFGNEDFSLGVTLISLSSGDFHPMQASVGELFRIEYPKDWSPTERYDFDWSVLKLQSDPIDKFDYNTVPV